MKAKIFDFENKDDNGKYLYSDEYTAASKDLEMILHKYVPNFSRNSCKSFASSGFRHVAMTVPFARDSPTILSLFVSSKCFANAKPMPRLEPLIKETW